MKSSILYSLLFISLSCGQLNDSISVKTAKIACECASNVEEDIQKNRECIKEAIRINAEDLEMSYKDQNIALVDENGEISSFYLQIVAMAMLQTECPDVRI